jgi:hypothetical protein
MPQECLQNRPVAKNRAISQKWGPENKFLSFINFEIFKILWHGASVEFGRDVFIS